MKEPKGYLTLDSREGVMKGGTLGPALVPGKTARQQIASRDEVRGILICRCRPAASSPTTSLPISRTWIAGGAPDPRRTAGAAVAKRRVVDDAELHKGAAVGGVPGGASADAAGFGACFEGAHED